MIYFIYIMTLAKNIFNNLIYQPILFNLKKNHFRRARRNNNVDLTKKKNNFSLLSTLCKLT